MPYTAKLTPRAALDIRVLYATGKYGYEQLGRIYGVKSMTVHSCVHGGVHGGHFYGITSEEDLDRIQVRDGPKLLWRYFPPPRALYTHFGSFAFTSYALRRYTRVKLSIFADCIQVCEHGATCEDCCLLYTGPQGLHFKGHSKGSYAVPLFLQRGGDRFTVDAITPMAYWYEALIGPLEFDKYIQHLCKNWSCVNIFHAHLLEEKDRWQQYHRRKHSKSPSETLDL